MNEKRATLLDAQIAKMESVWTAPVILGPLLEMMRLPLDKVRVEKVVDMISRDSGIAAQCLRLANSPLFGRRTVETIRSAIMALGLAKIRSLLFGLCMHQTVPKSKWVLDPNAFWRHSLGCALVTQRMAQRVGYEEPEKAYLAGLIHDIGFLVNSVLYTAELGECLKQSVANQCPLHVSEQRILGFTHEDAGRLLCKRWGMSEELIEVAGWHHQVDSASSAGPLVCLVHLGDLLCRLRNLGYGYSEILAVTMAEDAAWKHLVPAYPALADVDLVPFALDIDGSMEQIATLVDSVFSPVPYAPMHHAAAPSV
ncbi:MAG: HDOD domain-containing protein [Terriglobales bacterium]